MAAVLTLAFAPLTSYLHCIGTRQASRDGKRGPRMGVRVRVAGWVREGRCVGRGLAHGRGPPYDFVDRANRVRC